MINWNRGAIRKTLVQRLKFSELQTIIFDLEVEPSQATEVTALTLHILTDLFKRQKVHLLEDWMSLNREDIDISDWRALPPAPPPPVPTIESVSPPPKAPAQTESPVAATSKPSRTKRSVRDKSASRVRASMVRPDIPIPEMVSVPGGPSLRGTSDKDIQWLVKNTDWAKELRDKGWFKAEQPQQEIVVPSFEICRYPVTNREYQAFVAAAGYAPFSHWKGKTAPEELANHPVVYVSFRDALAYCDWLSQKTGRAFRLPTETEWEKAARGTDGRFYPWGNEFDAAKCNTSEGGLRTTTPVGKYSPAGDSPYGCADMAGNVWEWCSTKWEASYASPIYGDDDLKEDVRRVLRGGSFVGDLSGVRCAFRLRRNPDLRSYGLGFRVASPGL